MRRPLLRLALPSATALLLAFAAASACTDLKAAPDAADAGAGEPGPDVDGDGIPDGDAGKDAGRKADGGSITPAATGPGGACKPFILPCLDKDLPNVIEVPTEGTLATAFANAQANDVVQIKGALTVPAGWRIEPNVTLRGCEGAKIGGQVGFKGGGGTVEGFEILAAGAVFAADVTGSYVARHNRFTATTTTDGGGPVYEPGVTAVSDYGIVSADITMVVEENVFVDRPYGIEVATGKDTGTHKVTLTVRNNTFWNVAEPIHVYRSGLVGDTKADIAFNTFHGFTKGIVFSGMVPGTPTPTRGNLFANGGIGVVGGPFLVDYSLVWNVTSPSSIAPASGAFATGDPVFVDADAGDLRLGAGSTAIDLVPEGIAVPSPDLGGCVRPAPVPGLPERADVGAFEAQPL